MNHGPTLSGASALDADVIRSRLHDVSEVVATLPTLTLSGQKYSMARIVHFFGNGLCREFIQLSDDRQRLISALATLAEEAGRNLPDIGRFAALTEAVVNRMGHLVEQPTLGGGPAQALEPS